MLKLILLIITISSVLCGEVALRSSSAKGKLLCGAEPYEGAKILFYRINSKDRNQQLDSTESSPAGIFEVEGNTQGRAINETTMTPVVRIYHKCDEDPKKDKGFRRFQIQLPADFVQRGRSSRKSFDIGSINLQVIYPGEKKEKKID